MKIFDTHTHDYFPQFDEDRTQMLEDDFKNGVVGKIQISCDGDTAKKALDIAKKDARIFSTVGLHPCEVENNFENLDHLFDVFQKMLDENSEKIIAVGETGFDFFHSDSPEIREKQEKSFEKHLVFAKRNNLPVVLHTRNARNEMINFMRTQKENIGRGVFHCFSEDEEFAEIAVHEFGYCIGVGGSATYKKNESVRKAIAKTPIEFLLVETDSPYLAPQSVRGTRNQSKNITEIIELIAELKGVSAEKCSHVLLENTQRVFSV